MPTAFRAAYDAARSKGLDPEAATRTALAAALPSRNVFLARLGDGEDGDGWLASAGARSAHGWSARAAAERLVSALGAP